MEDPNLLKQIVGTPPNLTQGLSNPLSPSGAAPGDSSYDTDLPEPQSGTQLEAEEAAQLELSDKEINRLGSKVDTDFQAAINDHQRRMNRNRRFYYQWRSRIGQSGGENFKSNFKVPLTEWQLLGMLAKQSDAMFGDDAQIIARPTIPSNATLSGKVGDYMTWRVYESMGAMNSILCFNFMKLMFGRAHGYAPYIVDTYIDYNDKEVIDYQGPGFYPLMPDDFIAPAERVTNLHEFSWIIHRSYPTPDDLLEGEEQGKYFGITDNFKNILNQAQNKRPRDNRTDQVREIKEIFEGVNYYFAWSWGEVLEMHTWYGNWRMLLDPLQDAEMNDIDRRDMYRTPIVVKYLPHIHKVVGVQKLRELYPGKRHPRPFVESACTATGEYWCKGIPEMVEDAEMEMTATENIQAEAAERAMSPMVAVRPRAGQKFRNAQVEPGKILELDDPQKDVNVIHLVTDTQIYASRQQAILGYAERVTGLTDQSIGRASSAPNQPRTVRQSLLQNENESTRLSLDYTILREDWRIILKHFWTLESLYSPSEVFFRVMGKTPQGLYDVDHGFGRMTAQERGGSYDFSIKFATSVYSKEAKKQYLSEMGTMAMQTPLIANNPQAQYGILEDMYLLVDIELSKYLPKPPMPSQPVDPEQEWHMMLQSQPVHVNPLDQDSHHIAVHQIQFSDAINAKVMNRDEQAIRRLAQHILEHQHQQDKKIQAAQMAHVMQGLTTMLGNTLQNQGQPGQFPTMGPPQGLLTPGAPNGNGGQPPAGGGQPSPPAPVGQPSPAALQAPNAGGIAT